MLGVLDFIGFAGKLVMKEATWETSSECTSPRQLWLGTQYSEPTVGVAGGAVVLGGTFVVFGALLLVFTAVVAVPDEDEPQAWGMSEQLNQSQFVTSHSAPQEVQSQSDEVGQLSVWREKRSRRLISKWAFRATSTMDARAGSEKDKRHAEMVRKRRGAMSSTWMMQIWDSLVNSEREKGSQASNDTVLGNQMGSIGPL